MQELRVRVSVEGFCSLRLLLCSCEKETEETKMLLELRAENYAVIDHAVAEFGPGLNLLTGETGAASRS